MITAGIVIREKLGQQAAATFMGVPGLDTLFRLATILGQYVLPFITVWLVLLAVYKFLPHTNVRLSSAGWGAFVGAILIQIARPGFGLYVSHAIRYEKLYGSLGAIPIFLIWLWLLWILVLFGAEVAFTVQNIGLLQFRERIHHVSQRYIDRFLAARMLLYVSREFWRNADPMSVEKLADILQIPSEEARNAAEKLVQLGFLTPVGEEREAFHPSSDLSQIKVLDVLSISDQIRSESRMDRDKDSPWEQKLEEIFDRVVNARHNEIGDLSFHDLVIACEQAERENTEDESSCNSSE
ncbi:MAG: YihY/virulence factor BrkB family protein, partial [Planctomycetota bacterium]